MILDENKTRVLVSEALKGHLDLQENNQDLDIELSIDSSLSVEIIFDHDSQLSSIDGPLTQFNRDAKDNCVELSFKASILDSYEIFSITKNQSICTCPKYSLNFLSKTCAVEGPFRISLKEMSNFDYRHNQCTLCIELIKIDQ